MPAPETSQPSPKTAEQSTQPQPAVIAEEDNSTIEDEGYDDLDSLDGASSTASLSSTIFNYQYENGRRYHAYREGEYVIPNDEREQERLDIHHHIFNMVLSGELYRAPIPPTVGRILDLGTGTGNWAIDMADKMPSAIITGIDLSPIQPQWTPPNCRFEIDDFELDWRYSYPFDFIHARNIEGSVKDHKRLFQQAKDNLVPGGWIEVAEATVGVFFDDHTIELAPNLLEWRDRLIEASQLFGKPMGVAQHYKDWLTDAGFVNVKEEIYKVPYSPWAKDPKLKQLGHFQQILMLEALDAYSMALFTRVLGWDTPRIHLLLAGVRRELLDRKLHSYSRLYFVHGQKAP